MLALTAPYVRLIGAFHEGRSQDEVAVRAVRLALSQLLRGRPLAHGRRLDVPAGTAIRFEPGIATDVDLVPFVGDRVIPGLRGETAGRLDEPKGVS